MLEGFAMDSVAGGKGLWYARDLKRELAKVVEVVGAEIGGKWRIVVGFRCQ